MKNSDKPIHPLHPNHDGKYSDWDGLTKREYFAAMAMQGVLSHSSPYNYTPNQAENIIKLSINLADELLKQLETP